MWNFSSVVSLYFCIVKSINEDKEYKYDFRIVKINDVISLHTKEVHHWSVRKILNMKNFKQKSSKS